MHIHSTINNLKKCSMTRGLNNHTSFYDCSGNYSGFFGKVRLICLNYMQIIEKIKLLNV